MMNRFSTIERDRDLVRTDGGNLDEAGFATELTVDPDLVREFLGTDTTGGPEDQFDASRTGEVLRRGRKTVEAEDDEYESDLQGAEEPIAIYLREIDRVPLLKPHEEVELAQAIEAASWPSSSWPRAPRTSRSFRP
jgi:hypothetical protein